jgi:hypothetical protein
MQERRKKRSKEEDKNIYSKSEPSKNEGSKNNQKEKMV